MAHESGITKTVDPMAGSHYMEYLCDEIEDGVLKYLRKIDRMGGSIRAIERGFFQSEIRQNAYRLKKEADGDERILVGMNRFIDQSERQPELLRIDGRVEDMQRVSLRKLRDSRDAKKVEDAISGIGSAADAGENLMPHIVTAARAYATTGEISNTLRSIFGEYRPNEIF